MISAVVLVDMKEKNTVNSIINPNSTQEKIVKSFKRLRFIRKITPLFSSINQARGYNFYTTPHAI